jgi:hypothetical protein
MELDANIVIEHLGNKVKALSIENAMLQAQVTALENEKHNVVVEQTQAKDSKEVKKDG